MQAENVPPFEFAEESADKDGCGENASSPFLLSLSSSILSNFPNQTNPYMLYPTKRTLTLTRTTALISTVSFASTLVHAIALPSPLIASPPSSASPSYLDSSVRKSINFGPLPELSLHDVDSNPSIALTSWNTRNSISALNRFSSACDVYIDGEAPRCIGAELANNFVSTLHPESRFKLVDGIVSKHTNIFHGHFIELRDGVPIANANLNVNINLENGEVISYGDSTFTKSTKSADAKSNTRKWASSASSQIVLGGGGSSAQEEVVDILAEYVSPPFDATPSSSTPKASDPRHGLLTFLSMQSNNVELDQRISSSSRSSLISSLSVAPTGSSPHEVLITGLPDPTATGPAKASLVYVHDGEDLKLAWKYEYSSQDNMYESYMSADPSVTAGEEQPLMIVDWVRDFRPTGGEIGLEAIHEFHDSQSRTSRVRNSKATSPKKNKTKRSVVGERMRKFGDDAIDLFSGPGASTSDPKEIEKMKEISPEYKVYSWGVWVASCFYPFRREWDYWYRFSRDSQ